MKYLPSKYRKEKKKYEILNDIKKTRKQKAFEKEKKYKNKQFLEYLYIKSNMNQQEICSFLHIGSQTLHKWLKEFDIKKHFKPFTGINKAGYPIINGKKEYVIIIEKNIGRNLKKGEVIHHIDGNKKNSDIENLFLAKNNSEHTKAHRTLRECSYKLYKKSIIKFDKEKGIYYI